MNSARLCRRSISSIAGTNLRVAAVLLAVLVIMGGLALQSNRAAAYCSLSYGTNSRAGAGGITDWQWWETGPQAVSSFINSFNPDPVYVSSSTWIMMSRWQNDLPSYAQTGWARYSDWPSAWIFSQTAVPGQPTRTAAYTVQPFNLHLYEQDFIGGSNTYLFYYDSVQWDSSTVNWQPSRVEYAGETVNTGSHFPGSSVHQVEFTSIVYKRNYAWNQANLSYAITGGTGIPAANWIAGNDFKIWDSRCSD